MKKSRSWLATLLSVCLLITMLSVASFAAAEETVVKIEAETVGSYTGTQTGLDTFIRPGSASEWSNGGFFFLNYGKATRDVVPDISATFALTVDSAGVYDLSLYAKPGNGRGIFDVYLNDEKISTVDFHSGSAIKEYPLGEVTLTATTATLKLVCVGINDAATLVRYGMALDYISLTQKATFETVTVEAESLYTYTGTQTANMTRETRNDASYSGGKYVFINFGGGKQATVPDIAVDFTLNVERPGIYHLGMDAKPGTGRGVWDVYLDGEWIKTVDMHTQLDWNKVSITYFDLGEVALKSNSSTLSMKCVGVNETADETKYNYGLAADCFKLLPIKTYGTTQYEAESSYESGHDGGPNASGLYTITDGDKIGSTAVFRLTGLAAGTYVLSATTKNDYSRGIYTVSANGETVGDLDMYGANTFVTGTVGTFTADGGDVELTMVCTGKNAASTQDRYTFALDYFTVTPVVETAADQVGSVGVIGRGKVDVDITDGSATLTPTAATYGQNPWFAGWMVDGKWRADAALTLTANGSHTVTAYFPDEGEDVMAFFGQYNETIAVKKVTSAAEVTAALQNTTAPALGGYGFTGWDLPEDQAQAQFEAGTTITATAVYEQTASATGYHLTVGTGVTAVDGMGDAVDGTTDLSFDQRITVTAEGDVAYWVLDGAKVGFGKSSYTFYVSGDNDIAVVLTADAEPIAPAVVLQKATLAPGSEKSTLTVIAQTSIPSGNSVSEYGVIFASKAATLTAIKNGESVSASAALTVKSSKTAANQQYMAHLVNVKPNKTRYAMAYAVVDGETIYSVGTAHFVTDGVTQPVIE